jgi:hypothetical protein
MRSALSSYLPAAAVVACIAFAPVAAFAQQKTDDLGDREEITITHSRLGPLSDWAQMQQHTAEYNRLKAKFDPVQGSSHVDSWANDRALSSTNQTGDAFIKESAEQPTPPAVKAAEDAIAPP